MDLVSAAAYPTMSITGDGVGTYVYLDADSSTLKAESFNDGILRCKGCNYILSSDHITACRYCLSDLNMKNKKLRGSVHELEEELFRLQRELSFLRTWDEELVNSTSGSGDVTLQTRDGNYFKAHRFVLTSRSAVFKRMLESKDADVSNPKGVIAVQDMLPEVLGPLVEYMYTAQVSSKVLDKYAPQLLAAAHTYAIAPLKSACEEHLCRQVHRDNALTMLELALKCEAGSVKEAAYDAVSTTYKEDLLSCPDFKALLEREPRIAANMLKDLLIRASN